MDFDRTPPFVDRVEPGSPAALAGLQPDDLVVFVNNALVPSCQALSAEIERIDRADSVKLTVMRDQRLIEVELAAEEE